VLNMELLFDRRNARELDWEKVREQILGHDRYTIDAEVLAARHQAAPFFADFVQQLMQERPSCGAPRVIVILTSGVNFPQGTRREPIREDRCECRVYYFRQVQNVHFPFDEARGLLRHLDVRKESILEPRRFRKQLAELLSSLQEYAAASGPKTSR
jgi:hypothetical protein